MQSPDAKCLADRPTGVTAGMAFVATSNRTAASVLTPSAVNVRPDGTRVGTGAQLAAGDSLDSGIWQQGTTGILGPSSLDSSTIWSDGFLIPCPALPSYPLYCVEP